MSVEIIQSRLLTYNSQTLLEQENALKEIVQEIALAALSRADFFRMAAFQGGTCLRILYGLERFSEGLDFTLEKPDDQFTWDNYIKNMREEFNAYGFDLEVKQRSKNDNAVKTAFLKTDSKGGFLIIKDLRTNNPQLRIKLEIDTNPPSGSTYELKYLDFPLPYSIKTQDMSSLFAGKCHALLCREYVKGRDWYDFSWYIARRTPINLTLLSNAINQKGCWENQEIGVTKAWVLGSVDNWFFEAKKERIEEKLVLV
ncbi:MAG: nucleotidyl transferase AbiEii/AbiGii toxin family protein [Legionellales bacterium]|nr:nucleotidyl transferase AbiEii/AbiGii toxin family protein [Legionellales bacterium]